MIRYRKGYKYQLYETYQLLIDIKPEADVITAFVLLNSAGYLTVVGGYAWDGASGPAIDTKNFMRGSLIHDALYQLMREGHLEQHYRKTADEIMRKICREDGMSAVRAWWIYQGVRFGGGPAAAPSDDTDVLTAP